MEEVCRAWLDATTDFVSRAFPRYAELAVTEEPGVARSKGVEGLSALKADLRALVAKAPQIVEKELNVDEFWAHRTESVPTTAVARTRYSPEDDRPPPELYKEVSRVIGSVAPLLVRHGFGGKGSFGPWVQEFGRRGATRWRLNDVYAWSPEMATTMRRYAELYGDLYTHVVELETVEREKQQAEARNLWEQA
jgi:hypothetical protein